MCHTSLIINIFTFLDISFHINSSVSQTFYSWQRCIHQINFLSACNIERSFASMMKIETMNCFFDSSIDHIIKQFENIFFSAFLIKIICKESINCSFKNLFIVVFFVRWRFSIQFRIRRWWHFFIRLFFIRARNLIVKLFILWIQITYD
jgi:hypothetical protein